PQADEVMQKAQPASKRLLMIIAAVGDAARAKAGKSGSLDRYMMVDTLREVASRTLSADDFSTLSSKVELTFDGEKGAAADYELSANKRFEDARLNWKLGETKPLGVY